MSDQRASEESYVTYLLWPSLGNREASSNEARLYGVGCLFFSSPLDRSLYLFLPLARLVSFRVYL
jgi:hypothetical protein